MLRLDIPPLGQRSSVDYLLDDQVAVVCGRVLNYTQSFTGSQMEPVARAVAKRRNEFSTGRWLAMMAQRSLGLSPQFVKRGEDRSPRWPDGLIGSISHTDNLALVVLMRSAEYLGLGVDLEQASKVTDSIVHMVLTAGERRALADTSRIRSAEAVIFSGKEAVFKAVHPLVGLMIGFDELELEFVARRPGCFRARYIGPNRENRLMESGHGWFGYYEDHVVSSFVIPAADAKGWRN